VNPLDALLDMASKSRLSVDELAVVGAAIEYVRGLEGPSIESIIDRPYNPPSLFIFEEVELGGGYHTLHIAHAREENDWSKPYKKSGEARYVSRIVRVEYPPRKP